MSGRGARRLLTAAAALGAVVAMAVPAGAALQPLGNVSAGHPYDHSYGPLVGQYNNDGQTGPTPSDCKAVNAPAVCDTVPLHVDEAPPPQTLPVLHVLVTWDDHAGTDVLDTHLWKRQESTPLASDVADYEALKGGTPPAGGQQSITYFSPPPDLYLVVLNLSGANSGYHVHVSLEYVDARDYVAPQASGSSATAGAAGVSSARPGRGGQVTATKGVPGRGGSTRASGDTLRAGPFGPIQPLRTRHGDDLAQEARGAAIVIALLLLLITGVLAGRRVWRNRSGLRTAAAARFGAIRLFWKLLLPFVAVIVVIGIAGAVLTVRYLSSQADATLDRDLLQRSLSAQSYLRDQELYLLEGERYAANLEGVPEQVAAHQGLELAHTLESAVVVRKRLSVLAATDSSGHSLVDFVARRDTFDVRAGTDWTPAPAVRDVLAGKVDAGGDKQTALVRIADGSVYLVTVGPIRNGTTVGAVVAGFTADTLAGDAARGARGGVVLYDAGGQQMARSSGASAAFPTRLDDPRLRTDSVRERTHHDVVSYQPLVVRGTRVGTVAVSIPIGSAYDAVRGAGLRLALLVLIAMAAVTAFGVVISRYVLGVIQPVLETNRALGRGDLNVRAPVRSSDELGELAEGFNTMAEQLQASYRDLERQVAERTEELQRLYDENVQVSNDRSQFFATISHEFRTPLFAILANAELLADRDLAPDSPEELAAYAGTIRESAGDLLRHIDEILDVARSESQGVDLAVVELSFADLWADVAPGLEALARGAQLSFVGSVPDRLPRVVADARRLRQIVQNLVSNAVKYTPAGGRVEVRAVVDEDVLRVDVVDTGVGIPADVGDQVFEPYYRIRRDAPAQRWGSTGLGLALTKRLVDAHGGRIWFESREGEGSTFSFTLPLVSTPIRTR